MTGGQRRRTDNDDEQRQAIRTIVVLYSYRPQILQANEGQMALQTYTYSLTTTKVCIIYTHFLIKNRIQNTYICYKKMNVFIFCLIL
jgi:hypothetical protein